MDNACSSIADRVGSSELRRLVIDGLTISGLDVRPAEHDDCCRVSIACPVGQCTLTVDDWGEVEWEYDPRSRDDADPKLTADLASTLLTGQAGVYPRLGCGYEQVGITFKGIVGLELKARGLMVGLTVQTDENYFDTRSEIVVTCPGNAENDAKVSITDDGCVNWLRDYSAESATTEYEADMSARITDVPSLAVSIAQPVARAMSYLLANGKGRPIRAARTFSIGVDQSLCPEA